MFRVLWELFEKRAAKRLRALGLSRKIMILLVGSKAELREICLFILKGGEIQYSSDGNWKVADTTCLSLSPSFSLCCSHHFSPGQSASWWQRLSFSTYFCHNWFVFTAPVATASYTWHKHTVCASQYAQVLQNYDALGPQRETRENKFNKKFLLVFLREMFGFRLCSYSVLK